MASPIVPQSLPQSKRGRVPLVIGAVLVAFGLVGGAAITIDGALQFGRTVNAYQRISVVSGGTVELDDPGTYRVFFEQPGADEGFGSPGAFRVTGPDGQPVVVTSDSNSETYSLNGRDGRKIGRFRAETAGTYEIRPLREGSRSGSGTLAVGRTGPTGSIVAVLGGVFGGLLVVGIGVALIIIGGVRRSRARREALGMGGFSGTPMPGWGAAPAYPPAWSAPGGPSAPGAPMGTVHRSGWAPAVSVPPDPTRPQSTVWPAPGSPKHPPAPPMPSAPPSAPPMPPPLPTGPPPQPDDRSAR